MPDPMNVIMDRLAKLEAFLKKSPDTKQQPKPQSSTANKNAGRGRTIEKGMVDTRKETVPRNAGRNGQSLRSLKESFATSAKGKRRRGRNGPAGKGNRRGGKRRMSYEGEHEMTLNKRRKQKQTPTTPPPNTADHYPQDPFALDAFETTTTAFADIAPKQQGAVFNAAIDHLFATGVDGAIGAPAARPRGGSKERAGRRKGGVKNGRSRQRQKHPGTNVGQQTGVIPGTETFSKNSPLPSKKVFQVADGFPADQSFSDPLIDQISAKVAARITNSISQKLKKAKETVKKNDSNYAVHIIGDWIPPLNDDGAPKMNMTVQVNRTNNKDLKVTAQGMTVENTISKKTIDTAKNKTTSVTVEPPKQPESEKKKIENTTTPKPSKDILTVTVAPHPMMHYPWPYMYHTTMPSWASGGESEGQSHQDPPQHMYPYPPPMYAYPQPHQYPPPQSQPSGENQAGPQPPMPPGYAPYPVYPMYPGYPPPHWGGGRSGGEAR